MNKPAAYTGQPKQRKKTPKQRIPDVRSHSRFGVFCYFDYLFAYSSAIFRALFCLFFLDFL